MAGWIVSSKGLASGKVSWSPAENLRRMKAELVARRVELAVLPPKKPGGKPARSEVEIEDGKASFRIRLDDSLPVRDVVASAKEAAKEKASRDAYKGKWWLVKWSGNWADEINLRSSSVMKDSELKRFKKDMGAAGDLTVNVGTNQFIETTGAEYLGGCEFVEIKDASTRDFLLEHCDRSDDWSPSSVWENA